MKPVHYSRLLFPVLLLLSSQLRAQWQQTQGPEGGNVQDLIRHNNTLWAAANGLFYSTDEGEHWFFHPAIKRDDIVLDMHVHNNSLFAFVRANEGAYQNHIYRSQDDGQTWAKISQIPFWYTYSYRFATVRGYLFLFDYSEVLRSADDGLSWELITRPIESGYIWSDTSSILTQRPLGGTFISTDAAETWSQIADSSDLFGTVELLKDSLIIAPNFLGDTLRYLMSHDLGQTWGVFSLPPTKPMYGVSFHSGGGDTIFSRTDKLYWTTDFGANWHYWGNTAAGPYGIAPSVLTPDGAFGFRNDGVWRYHYATDQWEPRNTGLFNSSVNNLFTNGEVLFAHTSAGLFGSSDMGAHWQQLSLPPSQSNSYSFDISGDTLFWAAYRTLYAYPYQTPGNWDTLVNGLGKGDPGYLKVQGDKIVWIRNAEIYLIDRYTGAVDTIQPPAGSGNSNNALRIIGNRYVYMNNSGSVFVSDNQGVTWTKTLSENVPGNNTDNRLFYELGRLFASTREGLYISTDSGISWSGKITFSAWENPALGMTAFGNLLFLTLRGQGVMISQDFGHSWQAYNSGLGSLSGRALARFGDQIFVGTAFNGVWRRSPDLHLFSGIVYADYNNNGQRDAGEKPFPGVIVRTHPSNLFAVSQADGAYHLYAKLLADTFSIAPFSPYITVNPPFRPAGQGNNMDFGIYALPGVNDLEVSLVNTQPVKPGFTSTMVITYRNKGTTTQRPALRLDLDPLTYYVYAEPWPDSVAWPSTFFWNPDTLPPFESGSITVTCNTPPDVIIGDSISLVAHIGPDTVDQTPADNTNWLQIPVVGSFDPNDKQANPPERITPAQIEAGEPVVYTIRFQNTGNHPASFVRIVDTLAAEFDPASLRVLSASHTFSWSLRSSRVLEFYFENIQLPDSASNPVASNGFVQYAVSPRKDLPLNTVLHNRAFIYFDFNAPVETNTTSTVVSWLTTIDDVQVSSPLDIAPNPATDQLTITRTSEGAAYLWVQDMNGRVVLWSQVSGRQVRLPVTSLPQGIYSVFISGAEIQEWGRFVIQR